MQASNSYREQLTLHQSKILASLPTDDSLMQLQQPGKATGRPFMPKLVP